MAAEVVLPRQGWTMEVGSIVEWRKRDGDEVRAGEILFTLQSDKAVNEIEALDSGILRIPPDSPPPGKDVPIGTLLAYIVAPGESAPFESESPAAEPTRMNGPGDASPNSAGEPRHAVVAASRREGPSISPRARRIAAELGVTWTSLRGSGATGRIVERDVRAALADGPPLRINPAARRRAEELGVDVEALARTQPGKRVELADVEAAATRAGTAPASADPASGIRRLVARRLSESAHTTAPVTLTTEADATALVELREGARGGAGAVPSYNDLLVRICAVALREHPDLNASWQGDAVARHEGVHVGVAVETERGLLVPVVRDADRKSVGQIAAESARLVDRARAGSATADDLSGGTFTITNLGPYEIDAFTPIVNLPECAILGVGRIASKAVVLADERIVARKMVALSLTFDHRIVDGAPAARFLQRIKHFVERPSLWLLT